jgi:DNA-binding response OmpR family regulator
VAKGKILWVESKRAEGPGFVPGLRKKGFTVDIVNTGNDAVARLDSYSPDLIVVNSASMRTPGKRICRSVHEQSPNLPILVIGNPARPYGEDPNVKVVLELPFTARKLMNWMDLLLPWDGEAVLSCGPVQLDLDRRRVRCEGREARLTPHLTSLLRILMERTGEVLERELLFRQVWKTEYTADTRTLDVHISWLRQAIEADPRKPRYLITIRGVGYRLDPG